jgi:hypothetical protein
MQINVTIEADGAGKDHVTGQVTVTDVEAVEAAYQQMLGNLMAVYVDQCVSGDGQAGIHLRAGMAYAQNAKQTMLQIMAAP